MTDMRTNPLDSKEVCACSMVRESKSLTTTGGGGTAISSTIEPPSGMVDPIVGD